ncbi:MAG: DUF1330 domain-containing protein [Deltaproteobacteria bacterium]|nr:DUF1330 domain-containing protein [Deltaproteobacteria bacterium]
MDTIIPRPDQIQALVTDPDQGPVVMLNLLKFKERATGEEGTGADAYRRYGDAVIKMVEARGGRVLWSGRATHVLVGEEADKWDAIALVQYPSPAAFLDMATSDQRGVPEDSWASRGRAAEHGANRVPTGGTLVW